MRLGRFQTDFNRNSLCRSLALICANGNSGLSEHLDRNRLCSEEPFHLLDTVLAKPTESPNLSLSRAGYGSWLAEAVGMETHGPLFVRQRRQFDFGETTWLDQNSLLQGLPGAALIAPDLDSIIAGRK